QVRAKAAVDVGELAEHMREAKQRQRCRVGRQRQRHRHGKGNRDKSCGASEVGANNRRIAERGRKNRRHVTSRSRFSSVSASENGLSQRMRWTRGNRIATPDLCRGERSTLSKATSTTSPG